MMQHISLEHLRSRVANELRPASTSRIDAHLAGCERCRSELHWIQHTRDTLAALPLYSPEANTWRDIQTRLQAGETVLLPGTQRPKQRLRPAAAAALLVFCMGAAAAATIGREKVREWIASLSASAPSESMPATTDSVHAVTELTLVVAPENGTIAVTIDAPSAATRLRVRTIDGNELEVHATGAAAAARFRSAAGELTIVQPQSGEIVLGLPRSARLITVHANHREVLRAEHNRLQISVPADTTGPEILLPLGSEVRR